MFFEDDLTELNTIKTIKDFSMIDDKLEFMKKLVEVGVDGFIVEFGCRELDFARNSLPFRW